MAINDTTNKYFFILFPPVKKTAEWLWCPDFRHYLFASFVPTEVLIVTYFIAEGRGQNPVGGEGRLRIIDAETIGFTEKNHSA